MIDRTVISLPYTSKRLAIAEASGDGQFMSKLSKSITRSLSQPKSYLDEFRYVLEVIHEITGDVKPTHRELRDILVNELKVYKCEEEDTSGSFAKLIQKRNKSLQELGSPF